MESENWLLKRESSKADTCILMGGLQCGFDEVSLEKYKSILWVVDEADARKQSEFARRVTLFLLPAPEGIEFGDVLEKFILCNALELPDLFINRSVLSNDDGFSKVMDTVRLQFDSALRTRLTRQREGYEAQLNTLRNMMPYIACRVPDNWKGVGVGMGAAVVGAGPSLNVSVKPLAREQEKLIIIAADSALRPLAAHGVRVDIAVSVDVAKHPGDCWPESEGPRLLVCSSKCTPEWGTTGEGCEVRFLSGYNLTEDWLSEHGVKKTGCCVIGNCGITGVSLAHFLGCDSLYLFGMDHASDDTGSGYAGGVNLDIDRGEGHDPSANHLSVPGNYTEKVNTFLFTELNELNELLTSFGDSMDAFNVTDRGAKLDTAGLIHPEGFKLEKKIIGKKELFTKLISDADIVNFDLLQSEVQKKIRTILPPDYSKLAAMLEGVDYLGKAELCAILSDLLRQPDLSKVLGNFSIKVIPNVLKSEFVSREELVGLVKEAYALLLELRQLVGLR